MAASSTRGFSIPAQGTASSQAAKVRSGRRRRIDPGSGRALEILGHAIEYLTDELVYSGRTIAAHDPQVEAVQLLMALNRQVYLQCPEVPTFTERCRALFRMGSA